MGKKILLSFSLFFVLFFSTVSGTSAQNYLALQGSASGTGDGTNDVIVEIWDASSQGNLLYNSSNDFRGRINSTRFDILLGNGSQPLSLNFSGTYYINLYLNGRDMNFNGSDRQVFQSSVGNITVTTPVKTTKSLNVNDFFNVTASTSTVVTNGTVTILNTDDDDGLNLTGGLFIGQGNSGAQFTIGPLSILDTGKITTQASVSANGNVIINSIEAQALSINSGFNISGPTTALQTNGTITIQSRSSPALSIQGFNVSGASAELRTNGTITILSRSSPALSIQGFNISGASAEVRTNGTVLISNADVDDTFNVTNGGVFFRNAFQVGDGTDAGSFTLRSIAATAFTVNSIFNITGDTGGVLTNSTISVTDGGNIRLINKGVLGFGGVTTGPPTIVLGEDGNGVLNITGGTVTVDRFFNITPSTSAVRTNGTVTILSRSSPALSIQGFNVSGASAELKTNGTVIILNSDTDDALNVTGASIFKDKLFISGAAGDPIFTVNNGFNISASNEALVTNGTVRISNANGVDAFNVTGSAVVASGNLTIGINTTTNDQHFVKIGGLTGGATGTNKCSFIQMQDENGGSHFLFFDSGGNLRMTNSTPATCDAEGLGVGLQ